MIITARRRAHYLAGHPEMIGIERELIHALLDPDAIYRNKDDEFVAILVRRLAGSGVIRISVLTSTRAGFHNSVIIAWRMREADYRRRR